MSEPFKVLDKDPSLSLAASLNHNSREDEGVERIDRSKEKDGKAALDNNPIPLTTYDTSAYAGTYMCDMSDFGEALKTPSDHDSDQSKGTTGKITEKRKKNKLADAPTSLKIELTQMPLFKSPAVNANDQLSVETQRIAALQKQIDRENELERHKKQRFSLKHRHPEGGEGGGASAPWRDSHQTLLARQTSEPRTPNITPIYREKEIYPLAPLLKVKGPGRHETSKDQESEKGSLKPRPMEGEVRECLPVGIEEVGVSIKSGVSREGRSIASLSVPPSRRGSGEGDENESIKTEVQTFHTPSNAPYLNTNLCSTLSDYEQGALTFHAQKEAFHVNDPQDKPGFLGWRTLGRRELRQLNEEAINHIRYSCGEVPFFSSILCAVTWKIAFDTNLMEALLVFFGGVMITTLIYSHIDNFLRGELRRRERLNKQNQRLKAELVVKRLKSAVPTEIQAERAEIDPPCHKKRKVSQSSFGASQSRGTNR